MKYNLCVLILLFFGGQSMSNQNKIKDIHGKYIEKEIGKRAIYLNEDKSFFCIHEHESFNPRLVCDDTLAIGKWTWDQSRKFIRVNNNRNSYYDYLPSYITSSRFSNSLDSVYVKLNSPIEKNYEKGFATRGFSYSIAMVSDNKINDEVSYRKYRTNQIKFSKPTELREEKIKFWIQTYPDQYVSGYTQGNLPKILDIEFTIDLSLGNAFELNIPDFTFCYLTGKRLNDDFIKVSGNTLEWDGKIFKKVKWKN